MHKILISRGKKEYIPELEREVTTRKALRYYVTDLNKDFHTKYGIISKKDLKKKDGSTIKTDRDKEFSIFTSQFADDFRKLRRAPQTVIPKDFGMIIAETGLGKNDTVVDAGTGAGALACALANVCKKVITYETREDHIEVAKENIKFLGIKNITIKNKDITKGITEKNIDLITLDLPEPWQAIKAVQKALKIGGWLVAYTPTTTQASQFVEEIRKNESFLFDNTTEIIRRKWIIEGKRVRPQSAEIGHTAFLTFTRRIK
ncbi:methyltransferase domain-containing protein [Candidatus Woesearchaeota archaeon]|nr:methyltransferase domain-containing protein [Candidatus Woesearchaeota archaeon]